MSAAISQPRLEELSKLISRDEMRRLEIEQLKQRVAALEATITALRKRTGER